MALKLREIFPEVLVAGEQAGILTETGAAWLDPSGDLEAGIPLCPPEGDAGTGMTANQQCGSPYRKRICRYQCICYGCSGTGTF